MSVTTPARPVPTAGRNGSAPVRVANSRPGRAPWLALALVLVVGGALAAGLLVQSAGDRTAVLVAAREIGPGQVIAAGDLRTVDVGVDGSASVVPASQRSSLVGQVATTRIPEGSMLSEGQVAAEARLASGSVVVGALLGPGQLPVADLRSGDRVRLIAVSEEATDESADPLGEASIYAVATGTQTGTLFVSLTVEDGVAQLVSDVAAQQRLRLVLLPPE